MPVRNGGSYLVPAVRSLLDQSFADFELLAIDDGSIDGSASRLASLAAGDRRVRLLRNPGRGLVAALNFGLAEARGELVARMDADDVALPRRFERQVAFLDSHPEVAVLGTAVDVIDHAGRVVDRIDYPTSPAEIEARLLDRRRVEWSCAHAHPSVMARLDVVRAAGGYRAVFRHAEDYDLWQRLAERHRLANLPDRLLRYRSHAGQVSRRHAAEQRFATRIAQLAALARRAGLADPMLGVETLTLADVWRFDIDAAERAAIIRAALPLGKGASSIAAEVEAQLRRVPGSGI